MKHFYFIILTLLTFNLSYSQVIITEIADPNNAASTARFVEIHNVSNSDVDMTGWELKRWTNDNAEPTASSAVDLSSLGNFQSGEIAVIGKSGFEGVYGFPPSIISSNSSVDSNGDDQLAIFDGSGTIIDIFGVPGEDGTGTCHEFEDGRAERKATVTNAQAVWNEAEWNVWADSTVSGCTSHENSPKNAPDDFDPGVWIGATNCGIVIGDPTVNCSESSIGTGDGVYITIPYIGVDPSISSMTSSSSITGDDPALVSDGIITLTGLFEGDTWNLSVTGGDCNISINGIIEGDFCDPTPNTCFDLSSGPESFELVAVTTNSDSDVWVNNSGTYTMNGYCGSSCTEISDAWLVFGPLDTSQTSDLSLQFIADENYSETDLTVVYTEQYGGCPALSQWITAATVADPGTTDIDLSQANGTEVYIGIQYYEDGTGGSSSWSISNVAITSYDICPTLGTFTPSDCATCDVSLDTAVYTCNSNTVGDNNDGVIITIPYMGSEPSLTSITTSSTGNLGGDDPAQTADGNIILSGLNEGDSWDITLNGGDCDGTTISGTVPAAVCDPVTQDLIINEILADPAGDITGDSNGDGTRDGTEDEFIELYNAGTQTLDISGYTMEDGYTTRHTFPAQTTIGSGEFFVLFGGGSIDNFNGNSQVSSTGGLGLNNGTDSVILKNTSGNIVVQVDYTDGGNNQSVGRSPDFTGEFVLHTTISPNALFSPGLENDDPSLSIQDALINMFKVYPNPTNTGFVNIKSNQMGAVQAQVFDMLGKQMIDTIVVNERLEVSSLNAGIYIVKLTQNDRTTTKKLILQ
ncbi:MAG: hypothetical protein CMP79_04895 [Formosa sp.]|nr:hypothetical protein [Formosa sp.]